MKKGDFTKEEIERIKKCVEKQTEVDEIFIDHIQMTPKEKEDTIREIHVSEDIKKKLK